MKNKNLFTVLFLIFCFFSLYSQTPISNNSESCWVVYSSNSEYNWNTTIAVPSNNNDTLINNHLYKKIYSNGTFKNALYEDKQYFGAIRENNEQKILFIPKDAPEGNERLLQDYSAGIGDTLPNVYIISDGTADEFSFIVDTSGYYHTEYDSLKFIILSSLEPAPVAYEQIQWIQGIGTQTGGFLNIVNGLTRTKLVCYSNRDTIYYSSDFSSYIPSIDECLTKEGGVCDYITGIDNVKTCKSVNYYPNPFSESFTVENVSNISISNIVIKNVYESIIHRVDVCKGTTKVNINSFELVSPGLYFIEIQFSNGKKEIKKIIKL